MKSYRFETPEFGLTEQGIDLLRSKFHHETIMWAEINAVRISHGKELRYWWIILLIGIILLVVGFYLSYRTFDILAHKEHPLNYIKMVQLSLMLLIGGFFVFTSWQSGPLLHVNYANHRKLIFPIKKIIDNEGVDEFKLFINGKAGRVLLSK